MFSKRTRPPRLGQLSFSEPVAISKIERTCVKPGTQITLRVPSKLPLRLTVGGIPVPNWKTKWDGSACFHLHNLSAGFVDLRVFHETTNQELPGSPLIGWLLRAKSAPKRKAGVGRLEGMHGGKLRGWYYSEDRELVQNTRMVILINGLEVARCPLNELRPDLLKAGMKSGRYGFSLDIRDLLFRSSLVEVRAYCEQTGLELDASPQRISLKDIVNESTRTVARGGSAQIIEPPASSSAERGRWHRLFGNLRERPNEVPRGFTNFEDPRLFEAASDTLGLIEFLNALSETAEGDPIAQHEQLAFTLIDTLGLKTVNFFKLFDEEHEPSAMQHLVKMIDALRQANDELLLENLLNAPPTFLDHAGAVARLGRLLTMHKKAKASAILLEKRVQHSRLAAQQAQQGEQSQ